MCSNSRVKIYNKFICQITSPGVNRNIGNHIVSFVNCPEKKLKEIFGSELARKNGITRLEATIYNYSTSLGKEFDPIQDCLGLLENNKKYLENAPFYSVPLSKMWTKLTGCLENSCCLVFKDLLQYVYWGNANTNKLTGIQVNLPQDAYKREKLIRYTLSAFSFNCLPVNYIEVIADGDDQDKIKLSHKCYIKSGSTFFTKSSTLFSVIGKQLNLQELGLVDTCNVIPVILRKRVNISSKLYPYAIKEIDPVAKPYLLDPKKRKLVVEDTICAKKQKLEILNSIKEEHKAQLAKEKEFREFAEPLKACFLRRWYELDTRGSYMVYAFVVNDKNKFTYVGALAEKDGEKAVYYIKGPFKSLFIELNRNRQDFLVLPYTVHKNKFDLDIIYLPTKEAIATFNTNGNTAFNGHSLPKIENLKLYKDVWDDKEIDAYKQEDVDMVNAALMQEIKGAVKVKYCSRLEELEEGSEMLIVGIKEVRHRDKIRYVLNFENIRNLYVSNHWLETELQCGEIDLSCKTKIKLGKLKTTPNKHKERLVFWV